MGKTILTALVAGLLAGGAVCFWQTGSIRLAPVGLSYADLAATLLSSISVLLAILGFFIAVLAVLGLSQFRGLVRKAATDTARDHIDQRLREGDLRTHFQQMASEFLEAQFKSGHLRTLVEERVDYIIYGGSEGRDKGKNGDENEE